MASSVIPELDKTFQSDIGEDYGEMKIRVVVLKKRTDADGDEHGPVEEDDEFSTGGRKPTDPFLESPKRGKECCVFLINGQRQDAWDDTFIVRDLGLKYLRHRMLTVVDLDGLKIEAINGLMQGTRQEFYRGAVYHAVSKRLIAALKKDPDLGELEEEARQSLLDMRAADEAVKNKLDQLIEGHHTAAEADGVGQGDAVGTNTADGPHFANSLNRHAVVTKAGSEVGETAALPILVTNPEMVAVRMHRDETTRCQVLAEPTAAWANLQDFSVRVQPEVSGLAVNHERGPDRTQVMLRFTETADMEADEYPVTTDLLVFARFKGQTDTRMLKLPVVIVKPRVRGPRKVRELRDDPTYLRVVSRQPVKLLPNSPSLHVKLVWDGNDSLLVGSPASWCFRGRCLSLSNFPQIGFAFGQGGRLAASTRHPERAHPRRRTRFRGRGSGPERQETHRPLQGPRRRSNARRARPRRRPAPDHHPFSRHHRPRRPPYKLIYIKEENWTDVGCWVDSAWTGDDVGCFHEQTETTPLVLVLNEDFKLSRRYFEGLIGRLEEATINERKKKFYSHVAFHLYQMYLSYLRQMAASAMNEGVKQPEFPDLRMEINRVGTTLIKLMEVSR